MTAAEIDAYLAQFDVWDRNDFDNDGNFDEADGYIDHFQAVHAGEGEEAGGGARARTRSGRTAGTSTPTDYGLTGPTWTVRRTRPAAPGSATAKYWLGDYTTEPENGGLGVFAHEFGHDLGLPDYYDTAGGENGTAFWTLMGSGSWLSHGAEANEGIGTHARPDGAGGEAVPRLAGLRDVELGQSGTVLLNPAQDANAARTRRSGSTCPTTTTSRTYTTPTSGQDAWWTGQRRRPERVAHPRACPAASRVTVTASAWYDIEAGLRLPVRRVLDRRRRPRGRAPASRRRVVQTWTTVEISYMPAGDVPPHVPVPVPDGRWRPSLPGAFLDDITVTGGTR